MTSLYESLNRYWRSNPQQLALLNLSNTEANRAFVSNTLLAQPLSPIWTQETQRVLTKLTLKQIVKTLRPSWTNEVIDQVVELGDRMYPAGTLDMLKMSPSIAQLVDKLGIGITEQAPYVTGVKVEAGPFDLELARAEIATALSQLPRSTIEQQMALLQLPNVGYPVDGEDGLALHIITQGVDDVLAEVRHTAIQALIRAASLQLLTDPRQQRAAAEANGIAIDQPEQMYEAIVSTSLGIYPEGTYQLISSIPTIAEYVNRRPEVALGPPQSLSVIEKTYNYILQNYGLDPETDIKVKEAIKPFKNSDLYLVRNLALVLAQLHVSDPVTYFGLLYANSMDPLAAYNDKLALERAYYPQGISKALTDILGYSIRVKELNVSAVIDGPEVIRANKLFSQGQIETALNDLFAQSATVSPDTLNSEQALVVFVVCLSIMVRRNKPTPPWQQYVKLLGPLPIIT